MGGGGARGWYDMDLRRGVVGEGIAWDMDRVEECEERNTL